MHKEAIKTAVRKKYSKIQNFNYFRPILPKLLQIKKNLKHMESNTHFSYTPTLFLLLWNHKYLYQYGSNNNTIDDTLKLLIISKNNPDNNDSLESTQEKKQYKSLCAHLEIKFSKTN